MGIRKGYNTERCPACDTRLVVKHSRKNGKYHYCTYCGNILVGKSNEAAIIEADLSDYDSGKFEMRKRYLRMR